MTIKNIAISGISQCIANVRSTYTNSAEKTLKRYTSREIMGVMQSQIRLRFPGTCDIRYFPEQPIFDFPTSIFNPFHSKTL